MPCHSDPASCAAYEESQGTWLFTGIETVPAILGSFESRVKGSAQDDKEGFPLKTLPSFRLIRRADRDKKTLQTYII